MKVMVFEVSIPVDDYNAKDEVAMRLLSDIEQAVKDYDEEFGLDVVTAPGEKIEYHYTDVYDPDTGESDKR